MNENDGRLADKVQRFLLADPTCGGFSPEEWQQIIAALRRSQPEGEMGLLRTFADRIEVLAFEMKAPNAYTPQFVQIAQAMRTEAFRALFAAEKDTK